MQGSQASTTTQILTPRSVGGILSSSGCAGRWGGNEKGILSSSMAPNSPSRTAPQCPPLAHIPVPPVEPRAVAVTPGRSKDTLLYRTTASILSYLVWEGMTLLPALPKKGKGLKIFNLSHPLRPQWVYGSEMVQTVTKFKTKGDVFSGIFLKNLCLSCS